ncbi:hypothetical protein AKJ16_DCAP17493 [Drosera capensis]
MRGGTCTSMCSPAPSFPVIPSPASMASPNPFFLNHSRRLIFDQRRPHWNRNIKDRGRHCWIVFDWFKSKGKFVFVMRTLPTDGCLPTGGDKHATTADDTSLCQDGMDPSAIWQAKARISLSRFPPPPNDKEMPSRAGHWFIRTLD